MHVLLSLVQQLTAVPEHAVLMLVKFFVPSSVVEYWLALLNYDALGQSSHATTVGIPGRSRRSDRSWCLKTSWLPPLRQLRMQQLGLVPMPTRSLVQSQLRF